MSRLNRFQMPKRLQNETLLAFENGLKYVIKEITLAMMYMISINE